MVSNYFKDFEKAGANLSSNDKETLKAYNTKLASLINSFNKTLLDANNIWALLINDKAEFAGLIEIEIKSLENKEGEGWRIPLLNTTP